MRRWVLIAALALGGCKGSEVRSAALKLSWKPPRGVSLVEETPGALRFTGGVEIHSVDGAPPPIDEGQLDPLLLTVLTRAKLEPLPTRISARGGSVPAGAVARWVLSGGGNRALHYYLPLKDRFLTVSLTAPEGEFGPKESQLDLALSTLKIE
jgi:hypothetical protein